MLNFDDSYNNVTTLSLLSFIHWQKEKKKSQAYLRKNYKFSKKNWIIVPPLKCRRNLGLVENGNVLTAAKGMNQLSYVSITIFWWGGMCHLRFWCSLWSKANRLRCFGSAVQVCAPKGTRKSSLIKKLYKCLNRNPPNATKPFDKCASL